MKILGWCAIVGVAVVLALLGARSLLAQPSVKRELQYASAAMAPNDGYLLIGDSRVSSLRSHRLCGKPMAHVGFPGLGASDIRAALRRRPIRSPARTVIVAVGINDAKRVTPFDKAKWSRDLQAIRDEVRPAVGRLFFSQLIPPASAGRYSAGMYDSGRVTEMDEAISALGPALSVAPLLDGDGLLKAADTSDGTHLSPVGEATWISAIENQVCPH
jgi:hypothetical protein